MIRLHASILAFACALLPSSAVAQWWDTSRSDIAAPLITVTGEAVVNVVPDKCTITLGIQSREKDVESVQAAITTKAKSLLESLKRFGVAEKDIQTDMLMVDPFWEYGDGVGAPKSVSARQSFTVTITDIKRAQELLTEAVTSGANAVLGVDFQTSQLRKYRDQARQMALRAAREKAQLMATELGLTELTPYSVRELQTTTDSWYGWWWRRRGGTMSQNSFNSMANASPTSGSAGSPDESGIPPGQIAVSAAVSVSFQHSSVSTRDDTQPAGSGHSS